MEVFAMDAFAHDHLRQWFDAGHAPNDWTLETLHEFTEWIERHADEFAYDSGWTTITAAWERSKS